MSYGRLSNSKLRRNRDRQIQCRKPGKTLKSATTTPTTTTTRVSSIALPHTRHKPIFITATFYVTLTQMSNCSFTRQADSI